LLSQPIATRRPAPGRRLPGGPAGWALALSLAGHGLLLLGLVWTPAPGDDAPTMAVDTCVVQRPDHGLRLAAPAPLHPVLLDVPVQHPDEELRPVSFIAPAAGPAAGSAAGSDPTVVSRASGSGPGEPGGSGQAGGAGQGDGLLTVGREVRSVVYVLDRSLSMGLNGALPRAQVELLASLRQLPAQARFQVIAYDRGAEPLWINGRSDLLPAEPEVVREVARIVQGWQAAGATNHVRALQRGLMLRPEWLFFLTDANDLDRRAVEDVTAYNRGRTCIHVVELSAAPGGGERSPLWELARRNGGTYRRVAPEQPARPRAAAIP
jgi:hypothetical protein